MHREPPPVTVTAPGSGHTPPDQLDGAPLRPRLRPVVVLALLGVVVLGAGAVRGGGSTGPSPDPAPSGPPARDTTPGITATASLAGAATDQPYVQRLALTVDLPALDGRSGSGAGLVGAEVLLVDVRVRGFAVEADDGGAPVRLGRFGRSTDGRATTVPVSAVVVDCSVETQARRDIVLTVRTGDGPAGLVRTAADVDVVRALDRLVSRTCRRPRG